MCFEELAGTISTTLFAAGNIPMLLRAQRTRSLSSYSFTYLVLNNVANLLHWVYVATLPCGPIWVLHGFYTLAAALMLAWYLRYEIELRFCRCHKRMWVVTRGAHCEQTG